jgi:hypothetical protein
MRDLVLQASHRYDDFIPRQKTTKICRRYLAKHDKFNITSRYSNVALNESINICRFAYGCYMIAQKHILFKQARCAGSMQEAANHPANNRMPR